MRNVNLTRRMILQSGVAACVGGFGAAPLHAQDTERPAEGGIGGTGIVGLLTEFGSLYVNGSYVSTDERTVYTDGFGAIAKSTLAIGDSLTVEAATTSSTLLARRVHLTHPLVGAIAAISKDSRVIRVNGIGVLLPTRINGFGTGDRVAVSGLWRAGNVVASGLRPARKAADLVSGDVARVGFATTIGTVRAVGRGLSKTERHGFATVTGRFDASQSALLVDDVRAGRFTGAAGPLRRLSIEGYLDPTDYAPGFRVAGLGHSFARNLQLDDYADTRVLLSGLYRGKFKAQKATVLPEDAAARRRVLQQVRDAE